jgi:hypothetical protein
MDFKVTMSLSVNSANMVCEGCAKRGKHSLIGKEPMILVGGYESELSGNFV